MLRRISKNINHRKHREKKKCQRVNIFCLYSIWCFVAFCGYKVFVDKLLWYGL